MAGPCAGARGLVVLIAGAASNGDDVDIKHISPFLPYFGGGKYFGRFERELRRQGLDYLVCPDDTRGDTANLEERREVCVGQILRARNCGAGAVRDLLLVGHSLGGLIARLLAADPRVQACVRSVTTLSTPHLGTPLADALVHREELDRVGFDLFTQVLRYFNFVPSELHYIAELQTNRSGKDPALFAAQDTPDNPTVIYGSFTGSMTVIPIPPLEAAREWLAYDLWRRHLDRTPYGTRNDGIVPEFAMVHGQNLGHIDTNHWASACVDTVKDTRECTAVLGRLLPYLKQLY